MLVSGSWARNSYACCYYAHVFCSLKYICTDLVDLIRIVSSRKRGPELLTPGFTKYFFIHPLLLLLDNNSYIVRITIYTDENVLFPSLFISYCPFYRIYQRMPISVMLVRRLIFKLKVLIDRNISLLFFQHFSVH